MNIDARADLEDLFVYAQLVASNSEEAAELLAMATRARRQGDHRPAADLVQALARDLPEADGGWLARRQVPAALADMLPRIMMRLNPKRRLTIVRAFREADSDPGDRSVFLISVRRALESEGMHSVAQRLTLDALEEAMRRYLRESMAPVPEALEDALIPSGAGKPSGSARTPHKRRFPLSARIATGLLVILLASAIGTWITAPPSENGGMRPELFDRMSIAEAKGAPDFNGNNPEQVERFIQDRLGWKLSVPRMDGGTLNGVSLVTIGSHLELPQIRYETADGTEILLTVLDYRHLEDARTEFLVDRGILEQIAETGQVDVRNAPDFFRVTWRFRDDIYVAVTDEVNPDLRSLFLFE